MERGIVPLVDLKAQYLLIKDEIDAAIGQVLDHCDFVSGEEIRFFEERFAAFCGVKHAIGLASGSIALFFALQAFDVMPGDEVITTPFTFIATAEAISHCGAKPRFVDIDPHTFNINPIGLEAAITSKTKAIIPVHLYGQPADMDSILTIARNYGLAVIEDAAQAHGAEYKGRRIGSLGDVACFSFYPSKNLGACGNAGIIVTNDDLIAEKINLLRDHGQNEKNVHVIEGFSEKLDTLQAAVLNVKLAHLPRWNQQRRGIARKYNALLSCFEDISVPYRAKEVNHVYHLYVIRTAKRDLLRRHLDRNEISTGVHYPLPVHLQPVFKWLRLQEGDFPVAESAAREVLSLPMYPEMKAWEVERVVDVIVTWLKESK